MAVQLSAEKAKVWLLHVKHYQRARGSPSLNILREVCTYFEDLLLYQVTSRFFRSFNCKTATWSPQVRLSSNIRADIYSRWVRLKDGRLFCCGGGSY